ncbi:MAG: S8 family serine peptidase, partial [Primorskyibacter sp.]
PPHTGLPGIDPTQLVITGVIDDGINVFNQRFRPIGAASRIDYAWVQEAPAQPNSTVPYGRELTRDQISLAMDSGASEAELMVRYGLTPAPNGPYTPSPLMRAVSHGTHMADLAAGHPPNDPSAVTQRMITVQLPAMAVADTSGASLTAAIQSAADYVFDRALAMSIAYGVPIPVVLNLSFGLSGGARDGRSYLEQSLRAQSERYRIAVRRALSHKVTSARVLAAGNRALASLHAAPPQEDDPLHVTMRVQPDDHSPTFLELWLRETTRQAQITLDLPDGTQTVLDVTTAGLATSQTGHPARTLAWVLARSPDGVLDETTVVGRLTVDTPLMGRDERGYDDLHYRVVLALNPSQHRVPDHARAQPGAWGLTVTATDRRNRPTPRPHAWILRDTRLMPGSGTLRQAYFSDPAAISTAWDIYSDMAVADAHDAAGTRLSAVQRDGSLSGLVGNAPLVADGGAVSQRQNRDTRLDTVTVAARLWAPQTAASYSGADLSTDEDPNRPVQAPCVMAVSDTSRVLTGVLGSTTTSGGAAALNGTSTACALTSRSLAQMMQALPAQDYGRFVPTQAIAAQGVAPPRPSPTAPELVSTQPVRIERLADGGTLLPVSGDMTGAV